VEASCWDGMAGRNPCCLGALVKHDRGEHPEVVISRAENQPVIQDVVKSHQVRSKNGDRRSGWIGRERAIKELAVGGL